MVQTVYYYLDSNSESRHFKNAMKHHPGKLPPAKQNPTNISVEPTKVRGKKNNCIKLHPLNGKVESNVLNTTERKFSYRLNPLPNKPAISSDQKKLPSKIPVLQRKLAFNTKQKNDDVHCDNTLSAADRRQKFHQSRLRVADASTNDASPVLKKQTPLHYDVIPWYEGYVVHKVMAPPVPVVNQKSILPPIKPVDMSPGTVQKVNQPKNKCLLGEITHFPALCNPQCSNNRKNHTSTVPHLPPILPPPAAPPPSISTSLEKDGNRNIEITNDVKQNEVLCPTKSVFHKIFVHV